MNIRFSKRLLTSAAVAAAMALVVSGAKASPGNGDPFQLWFNEAGVGSYAVFNASTGGYGPTVNDPGFLSGGFLTYALPEQVGLGDVGIGGDSGVSDGLRFQTDGNGNYFMQYYSDAGGTGGLADTGFPTDFNFAFVGTNEGGQENGFQAFTYVAGNGDPASTNFYHGVSDVPEASTWAMMVLGFAGLGLAGYRARSRSTALAV
jgi:hypothetical protein